VGSVADAPYTTTLYLLDLHSADQDFTDVVALTELPSAAAADPRSFDRRCRQRARPGALFKNDKQGARDAFERAMRSDPSNPVPFLNAAFTDLQSTKISALPSAWRS